MQVIDVHTHIFPDAIAEGALKQISEKSGGIKWYYDGTRNGMLKQLKADNITAAINCPIATSATQTNSINNWAARINQFPVLSMGSIHPDNDDKTAILRGIKESGLIGIKLHPEYQYFSLEDKRMTEVWEACSKFDIPIIIHTGADAGFEPPYKAPPADIRKLIEKYSDLKLIAAHFGGWQMWNEVEKELIGKDIYLDTAFLFPFIEDPEHIVKLIRQHGVDKVMFGTDSPWQCQAQNLKQFLQLPLTKSEQEAILHRNALRLFNIHLT